jgi:hypothetical protein
MGATVRNATRTPGIFARPHPRNRHLRRAQAAQVRELLAPVYGWFTEGFDIRDLKETKALLEGLAA